MTKPRAGALCHHLSAHPHDILCIVRDKWAGAGGTVHCYLPASDHIGMAVATYSRERDAKRELRRLGYVQDGKAWRSNNAAMPEIADLWKIKAPAETINDHESQS